MKDGSVSIIYNSKEKTLSQFFIYKAFRGNNLASI